MKIKTLQNLNWITKTINTLMPGGNKKAAGLSMYVPPDINGLSLNLSLVSILNCRMKHILFIFCYSGNSLIEIR